MEMDFSAEHSSNLPVLLERLDIALAFTSYQAGRLMLVRSAGGQLDVNYKSFPRPMGLTVTRDSLTLGIFTQVLKFQREDGLLAQIKQPLPPIEQDITAPRIRPKEAAGDAPADADAAAPPVDDRLDDVQRARLEAERARWEAFERAQMAPVDARVDACFISRSAHYTGMINIHDIDWGDEGLWAVNSSFSCLCTLSPDASFVPRWKPHFISELVPEDRCHLNGMTLRDGRPAYVTTFSTADQAGMWRRGERFDGTLMDVQRNAILLRGLAMPHSPRWYRGHVYYCNSGEGQLCRFDPASGRNEVLAELPGFTRGMDFHGPLLFVGLSKVRRSDVTATAPLADRHGDTFSGIWVFNLDTLQVAATLSFTGNVDQIYDVAVLPGCHFPELIEPSHPRMRNHFSFPPLAAPAGDLISARST
ncbi:TIGR03032 family protein [Xanthomonas sp. XNM01]|uniref:TIGR03032 family protein n=1 Tax=Xanthomonas sp. XNM01 TaxID=2769289 RepID=UPI001CE0C5B2|nr:TIGR03032 family protein [Xanthomonas sp. XNM01]